MVVAEPMDLGRVVGTQTLSLEIYESRLTALLLATHTGIMTREVYCQHSSHLMKHALQQAAANGLPMVEVSQELVYRTQRALYNLQTLKATGSASFAVPSAEASTAGVPLAPAAPLAPPPAVLASA